MLEVGSLDVNGSLRAHLQAFRPASYLGVDITQGPGVDEVCDAGALLERFGPDRFDIVVTTEMLEHVRDWSRVLTNLKGVLKPGGILVLTTRSPGFPYHGFPHDFWRYEVDEMGRLFADFQIEDLRPDPMQAGVFIRARKPLDYRPADLSDIRLLSMVTGKPQRVNDPAVDGQPWWSPPVRFLRAIGVFGWIPASFKIRVQKWLGILGASRQSRT